MDLATITLDARQLHTLQAALSALALSAQQLSATVDEQIKAQIEAAKPKDD